MGSMVLCIDTATRRGSIALAAAGGIIASELPEPGAHARDLLARIDTLIGQLGGGREDLAGIVVVVGPGSFTGVRVGMATAKGIGYSLDIPVVGISTLEAMAMASVPVLAPSVGQVCPAIEAGRGEVYASLFAVNGGRVERRGPDRAWKPGDLAAELPHGAVLIGDGAPLVNAAAGGGYAAIESPALAPAMAAAASRLIPPGGRYAAGGLGPNYVRPSDAEAARRRT
jgi:tRNA threonylcarbamoyladenosine biosynthesis protein TsaB